MIGVPDDQILEHFKESFPQKIDLQSLKLNDTDVALEKTRVLGLLFPVE